MAARQQSTSSCSPSLSLSQNAPCLSRSSSAAGPPTPWRFGESEPELLEEWEMEERTEKRKRKRATRGRESFFFYYYLRARAKKREGKRSPPIETTRRTKNITSPSPQNFNCFKERRRRPFSPSFSTFYLTTPTSTQPDVALRGSHIAIAVMPTAQAGTASAETSNWPSERSSPAWTHRRGRPAKAEPRGAAAAGPASTLGLALSSLWSRCSTTRRGNGENSMEGSTENRAEFFFFFFSNGSAYLLRQVRIASTGKDPFAPPLANRQIEARS